jgi:hypothetical protein
MRINMEKREEDEQTWGSDGVHEDQRWLLSLSPVGESPGYPNSNYEIK